MTDVIEKLLIKKSLSMDNNVKEKAEWLSSAWQLKEIIDKGFLKGFSKKDYTVLKWINLNYNRAKENKYKKDAFKYLLFGDNAAEHLSDEGFKKLKEIYNTRLKLVK